MSKLKNKSIGKYESHEVYEEDFEDYDFDSFGDDNIVTCTSNLKFHPFLHDDF